MPARATRRGPTATSARTSCAASAAQLRRSLRDLQREGFRRVFVLRVAEEVDAAEIVRAPLWTDRRDEHGPFDIIGDVHGCHDELVALLDALGYVPMPTACDATPTGRTAVFVGDLVDRGPRHAGGAAHW